MRMSPHLRAACISSMILVSSPAPAQEERLGLPAAEDAPPARGEVERVIEVDADAADDAAIRRRLEGIFGSIDGLAGIAVGVEAGVVTLSGEVGSQELDARASRLAGQVEGVVEVEDRVGVTRDLGRRIGPAVERLSEADIVIVEGWKRGPHPKIELRRAGAGDQVPLADTDPSIIAIAADYEITLGKLPVFDINDSKSIADFVVTSFKLA